MADVKHSGSGFERQSRDGRGSDKSKHDGKDDKKGDGGKDGRDR